MRIARNLLALAFAGAFLFVSAASAQNFTTVTATVKDPNGVPYGGGSMSAVCVPGSAGGYRLGGQPYSCQVGDATLDATGSFTVNFGSNASILPAGTQWQITVRSNPGGVAPPWGTGAQAFTVTMTISGATQNISSTLNAAAPALTQTFSSGGGTPGGSSGQIQFNNAGSFGGIAGSSVTAATGATTLTAQAIGTTPLAIDGATGQTATLLDINNQATGSADTPFVVRGLGLGSFTPAASPALGHFFLNNQTSFAWVISNATADTNKGAAGLSILEGKVYNNGQSEICGGDPSTPADGGNNYGCFTWGNQIGSAPPETIIAKTACNNCVTTIIPFAVQGAIGQTADLFDFLNSSAAVLSGFDSAGNLYFNGATSGIAKIGVPAIAGTNNIILLPTSNPSSITQVLGLSNVTGLSQLAWVTPSGTGVTNQVAKGISANASGTSTVVDSTLCTPPAVAGQYTVGYFPTTNAAVAPSCPQVGLTVDQAAGSAVLETDNNNTIYGPAAALSLPTPTSLGNANFFTTFINNGSASTITPVTDTISKNGGTAGSSAIVDSHTKCSDLLDQVAPNQWDLDCVDIEGYINGLQVPASATGLGTNSSRQFVQQTSANILAICTTCVTSASALTAGGIVYGAGGQAELATAAGTAKQIVLSGGASAPTLVDFPDVKEIPAANCNNATAGNGWSIPSGGTVTCRAGTNNQGGYITITDTSSTFAQFMVTIPEDWDTATDPYIRIVFASATDTTNGHTVIPQIKVSCPTAGNGTVSDDATFSAAQSLSTTTFGASAVANGFYDGSNVQIGSTQMTGCIQGGLMIVQVGRATDTATGNINFYSASLTFPRLLTVQAN
jgi:hypothetical protein